MKKLFNLYEVFTPSKPALLTYIERKGVIKQLLRALKTPGKQLIVYGHSGSGKTTIVRRKLEELKLNYITTQCMEGIVFNDLIIEAFNKLDVYYSDAIESSSGGKIGGSIAASFLGIKASLGADNNSSANIKSKRAVKLPITPQTLAEYFGEASVIWIIEDFHKIDPSEKRKLSQVMKIFMDQSEKYNKLKIIAIGAVNTARQIVEYDPEMKNRVSEIEVPLMKMHELKEIISRGNELLNFYFSEKVVDKIATYSSGLASVTHQLSLLICEEEEIDKTLRIDKKANDKSLEAAIDDYLFDNSDSLKHAYDTAIKCRYERRYESPIDILAAILRNKKESQTIREIANAIKEKHARYKEYNLRKYVEELTSSERAEVLRHDADSDTYSFSTPFIKAYCYCMFNNYYSTAITKSQIVDKLKYSLEELEEAQVQFLRDFYSNEPAYLNVEDEDDI